MKKIGSFFTFMLLSFYMAASPLQPSDTTFHYNNRKVVITENDNEMNVSVYHQNEQGEMEESQKLYEGIFTNGKSIERVYQNSFEISIPEIFKPKSKRRPSHSHWAGFGVGFSNMPVGLNFEGELSSIINRSRSLQYNLNILDGSWRIGNSNFSGITGMGIQFNAIHWQNNKAIEIDDYKTIVTTTLPGEEYSRSRMHYTYLTFPLLIETNWDLGNNSHLFINAGLVGKIKTASSSAVWVKNENGKKDKIKLGEEINLRPITMDIIAQAGINDWGLFVSYSPFNLFVNNKGPEANQATIGVQLYF